MATNKQAGGVEEQKPRDKEQHNNKDEWSILHLGQGGCPSVQAGWLGSGSAAKVLGSAGEQQAELSVTHPHGNSSKLQPGLR